MEKVSKLIKPPKTTNAATKLDLLIKDMQVAWKFKAKWWWYQNLKKHDINYLRLLFNKISSESKHKSLDRIKLFWWSIKNGKI